MINRYKIAISIQTPMQSNLLMTTIHCVSNLWQSLKTFKLNIHISDIAQREKLTCLGLGLQLHCNISLSYNRSYYHRNTGTEVYSLDINIDVYGSDQNRANPLLKVNNVCVDCIVSPLGGDRWLFKNLGLFVIESFIQEICSKTLIDPVLKKWSINEWVIKSFI